MRGLPWLTRRLLRTLVLAALGALVGLALAGRSGASIGPFDATLGARPALQGETVVHLPPLGSLVLDTHTAPLALEVRVDELRAEEAARIAADPSVLDGIDEELARDARSALVGLAVRSALAVLAGAVVGALLSRASWQTALQGLAVGATLTALAGGAVAGTFRAEAVREPEYRGLLAAAPQAVGDVASLVERFDDYSAQLSGLVRNVVALYRTADALPQLDPGDDVIRLLHISDLHNNPQGFDLAAALADQFEVDAVIDSGDISDWGSSPEAQLLERVADFEVPYLFVRGNHDSPTTEAALAGFGAVVLDGDPVEVAGLRIWGVGDPRFTPDQQTDQQRISPRDAWLVGRGVRADGAASLDLVVVHDPAAAAELDGLVPLVLAGHRHEPDAEERDGTIVLTEGSTGGAGLRGLQGDEPEPLTCTVLYFSRDGHRLIAYDRISVSGFGGAAARIERHVVDPAPAS